MLQCIHLFSQRSLSICRELGLSVSIRVQYRVGISQGRPLGRVPEAAT